ncbi:hypothetical protein DEO72_LG6g932 [Vigna unguiculata]|uniref:Myb-like domain-containing protein n=1 Tax=Vigna unguiculata TaxID=3917 RepID=A0A4D6M6D7_VIGUN|nr:hypothetical protein DEO72_LG6g932 [Vigna unguiculata]
MPHNRKPNEPTELDESEVGNKRGTVEENKISELMLLRIYVRPFPYLAMSILFTIYFRYTNSEETIRKISTECLINPLLQIQPHATEMLRTELAACAGKDPNKTRKRSEKLPIRGGKKLSSMNKQKEPFESSGLAPPNQTKKGKEKKFTSKNTQKEPSESSGLASPNQTRKGKEPVTSMNTQKEPFEAPPNQTTKGKEKVTSMNTQKEPFESSGLASPDQTAKGKEKVTWMNTVLDSSESAAPTQSTKGKEKVLMNTTPKCSGSLNNLFDFETIMRSKLAAAVNAASPWKDVNVQCSSPMDRATQEKNIFNSSSNLENGLAQYSASNYGNTGSRTSRTRPGFLNYKDVDDDWSEMELEALLSFVKKYGLGNWHVKFVDPDLQIIRNKTARELSEKWEKVASKMLPYIPSSYMVPVTADRSTLHASHGNGFHSTVNLPTVQPPRAKVPIHRPSARIGIPPIQLLEGNQALNWGRITPSSNGTFGPYFQGSSTGAFHSLPPLNSARPRELNTNFNTMNAQLMAQFHNERSNLLAQNFRPTSVQTPQIPPLSLGETTVSSPANVGTEARPQLLLGGQILYPNNLRLNENAGYHHNNDNRK